MSFKRTLLHSLHPQVELFSNMESLLILERSLEATGQRWIENLNVIEHFLINIIELVGSRHHELESTFILRRLPTFTAPFVNKNEYGIVLDNINFTLSSPLDPRRRSTSDRVGTPNFGQTEVFYTDKAKVDAYYDKCKEDDSIEHEEEESSGAKNSETLDEFENYITQFVNSKYAYRSHEIFKKFATAFLEASHMDFEELSKLQDNNLEQKNKVQIIGPHLLNDLKFGPEMKNIFKLVQSNIPLKPNQISRCIVKVNHLKSLITISIGDTEITVRPCLFLEKGYTRVHANLMERIPLYHSSILNIGQSLAKGCLIFPTSFETLWTLQFWPQESHIICAYHPNSIVSRLLKIHSGYCINPVNLWETINNNFLIGVEDMSSLIETSGNSLNVDFAISSFLYELENFSKIEDWAPRNFFTRLIHLLRTTVDCYEKGFHSHYFTKINVLRGIWRTSGENFCGKEEKSVLRELDDIDESPENTEEYCDKKFDDFDDEFGFFDTLDTGDENRPPLMLTSDMVYKSVNPFQSLENITSSKAGLFKEENKKPATLSKMFGSSLIRKFSNKLSRSKSDAELPDPMNELKKPKSMMDIASSFEESVAQMRRENVQNDFLSEDSFIFDETTSLQQRKQRSCSVPQPGPSRPNDFELQQLYTYDNAGLQDRSESLYSNILQTLVDLPPSDHLSDMDLLAHLDLGKRKLESQEELIVSWCRIMEEVPKPKFTCPHAFSPRQIQYLSIVVRAISQSSPGISTPMKTSKLPSWEISGDILKIILHQMRSEITGDDSLKEKRKPIKKFSFKLKRSLTENYHTNTRKRPGRNMKFSFRKANTNLCKNHVAINPSANGDDNSLEMQDAELALEDPETAATKRMLNWLWQLRNSEIGRLSSKANKYLEELYSVSFVNSHFLDQFSEEKIIQNLAIRSAVAVSRIIVDEKFPAHVPLLSASKKGWAWAEMILSLSAWNREKGFIIKAEVVSDKTTLQRDIDYENYATILKKDNSSGDPDSEAVTLAFHSEIATPIGWNDFEDPRRPGPYTVPILIHSSHYFKLWEVVPGNVVHTLLRLKKFNSLQHVGSMLLSPHRKTALSEVRKLNKSLSFRSYQYDDNVMSKTFKRLASLRATRQLLIAKHKPEHFRSRMYTCQEIGCATISNEDVESKTINFRGKEFDCTRM